MPSFEIQADIFTRLSVFDSPKGSSNTFKTHKNISLYFKRRYLIIYKYFLLHRSLMQNAVTTLNWQYHPYLNPLKFFLFSKMNMGLRGCYINEKQAFLELDNDLVGHKWRAYVRHDVHLVLSELSLILFIFQSARRIWRFWRSCEYLL